VSVLDRLSTCRVPHPAALQACAPFSAA